MPTCEIRCLHCRTWQKSMFQFGDAETFFDTAMHGNRQQCTACGKVTGSNKENMRFRADDEGFVGEKT